MKKASRGLSIVGSSRDNGVRAKDDFYPTPSFAVSELLNRELFEGNILEPACGDGAISKVLLEKGYEVFSSDLVDRGFGLSGIDFLTAGHEMKCNNIITNPPYKNALDFILKAKALSDKKIAMLLKTTFLESEVRREMFLDKEFPLKTMYQFSKRITLYKNGTKMNNSGMIAYAWFVWDKQYVGLPTIQWI